MAAPRAASARAGRVAGRLLALLVALVVSLAVAEAALAVLGLPSERAFRFLGPLDNDRDMIADARTFWRLDPRAERFTVNRLRLRGWLPRGDKLPSDVRIAVVGDSCTFGSGVGFSESYGPRLERAVQRRLPERRVETIVAAMPGYSSHQSRLLYTREIAPLAPDASVFYLGAFNDYQDANGFTDAERTALRERPLRRALGKSRIGRVLLRLDDPELAPENQAKVGGRRRVSLEEFRANLEALVASARSIDSTPILVVPPLPARTIESYPVSLEYRRVVHEVAEAREVLLVDAPALFAPYAVELPSDWPATTPTWPLFVDAVHPSPYGHGLLVEALLAVLAPEVEAWSTRPRPALPAPSLGAVTPRQACAFEGATLRLHGTGLDQRSFDRAFVGDVWIPRAVLEDGALRLPLPPSLPVGTSSVSLVTRAGLIAAAEPVTILAPTLPIAAERIGDTLVPRGELHGPPGWYLSLWAGPRLRPEPAPTTAGPFWLAPLAADDPDGRPPGVEHGLFAFERLRLPNVTGSFDADGRWVFAAAPYPLAGDEEAVFAQALYYRDAGRCVLTAPLRLEVGEAADR